jgi:hypothetical protein
MTHETDNGAPAGTASTDNAAAPEATAQIGTDTASGEASPATVPTGNGSTTAKPEKPKRGPVRRFFRSVFSHLAFAALVVAGVVGYLNHRQILGRIGDELCSADRLGGYMTKAQVPPAIAERNEQKASATEETETDSVPSVKSAAETEVETEAKQRPSQKELHASVSEPTTTPTPTAEPPAAGAASTSSEPDEEAPTLQQKKESAAASPAMPEAKPQPGAQQEATLMDDWQAARAAYSARKPEAADAYAKLVEKYPDVVALHGEYGNVLFGIGRTKDAVDQYYAAALLHLRGPQPGMATCLADVIQRIDPVRAEELKTMTTQPCPYRQQGGG